MKKNLFIITLLLLLVFSVSANMVQLVTSQEPSMMGVRSRFIELVQTNRPMSKEEREAHAQEFDNLYSRLVLADDIETFKKAADKGRDWHAGAALFGIMEIADRNYSNSPTEEALRKKAFSELVKLTDHENPHVRGAAFYALGKCRRYEYKEAVADHILDIKRSGWKHDPHVSLVFPPCSKRLDPNEPDGLVTTVYTAGYRALQEMLEDKSALEYIKQRQDSNSEAGDS
jgi:hypothetical protein